MDAAIKGLISAVSSAPDSNTRVEELLGRLPEGHDAVSMLVEIDRNAISSPACCLTFYTIINARSFADKLIRMNYEQNRAGFQ